MDFFQNAWNWIQDRANDVGNFFNGAASNIGSFVSNIFNGGGGGSSGGGGGGGYSGGGGGDYSYTPPSYSYTPTYTPTYTPPQQTYTAPQQNYVAPSYAAPLFNPVAKKPVVAASDDGRHPWEQEGMESVIPDEAKLTSGEQFEQDLDRLSQQRELAPKVMRLDEVGSGSGDQGSKSMEERKKDFDEWLTRSNDQRTGMENAFVNAFANTGEFGQDFSNPAASRRDESDPLAGIMSEVQRRFTNMNDGSIVGPGDWNYLGFTSQQTSPDAVKNLYEGLFDQEDRDGVRNENGITSNLTNDIVDKTMIDDGADPSSREGLYMTGEQYLKYRNLGIPGRPVDEIYNDPDKLYNKQDELQTYGFQPYIVSEEGLDKFHDAASSQALSNVFKDLTNFRRNATDYTYNYEDQQYSGKDFDKNVRTWMSRGHTAEDMQNHPKVYNESETNEYSIPLSLVARDEDGNEKVLDRVPQITRVTDPATLERYPLLQQYPIIAFFGDSPLGADGVNLDEGNWYFRDDDDLRNSLQYQPAGDGPVTAWSNEEPLTLDDGRQIRADKAREIASAYDQETDANRYADYGWMDMAKPAVKDPFIEGGGGFLPWITDMALSSVPLFFRPTAAAQALGDSANNISGVKPGYQDSDHTYRLLSENPTQEQRAVSTAGSALLPVTERLWGPLGKSLFGAIPGVGALTKRFPNAMEHPVARWATGAIGEGLEEIPGNLVEEMQQAGSMGDYFANDLYYDDDGNLTTEETLMPALDSQGKRLKDQNTDTRDRFLNFMEEVPLSLLGGATLGGTLGAVPAAQYAPYYKQRKAERDQFGDNLIIPESVRDYTNSYRGYEG